MGSPLLLMYGAACSQAAPASPSRPGEERWALPKAGGERRARVSPALAPSHPSVRVWGGKSVVTRREQCPGQLTRSPWQFFPKPFVATLGAAASSAPGSSKPHTAWDEPPASLRAEIPQSSLESSWQRLFGGGSARAGGLGALGERQSPRAGRMGGAQQWLARLGWR